MLFFCSLLFDNVALLLDQISWRRVEFLELSQIFFSLNFGSNFTVENKLDLIPTLQFALSLFEIMLFRCLVHDLKLRKRSSQHFENHIRSNNIAINSNTAECSISLLKTKSSFTYHFINFWPFVFTRFFKCNQLVN